MGKKNKKQIMAGGDPNWGRGQKSVLFSDIHFFFFTWVAAVVIFKVNRSLGKPKYQ